MNESCYLILGVESRSRQRRLFPRSAPPQAGLRGEEAYICTFCLSLPSSPRRRKPSFLSMGKGFHYSELRRLSPEPSPHIQVACPSWGGFQALSSSSFKASRAFSFISGICTDSNANIRSGSDPRTADVRRSTLARCVRAIHPLEAIFTQYYYLQQGTKNAYPFLFLQIVRPRALQREIIDASGANTGRAPNPTQQASSFESHTPFLSSPAAI